MARSEVAFSLLSRDENFAQEIRRFLPAEITAFVYTEEQESLLGALDSVEALGSAFRDAQICVVLHREGWGQSKWTRFEGDILKDRLLDEGSGFLVLVRLDDSPPPAWLPRNNFWVNYAVEGPERTASYIAARYRNLANPDTTLKATRRTFDRQPVPVARYQLQMQKITKTYIPVRPEICDACTGSVVFRPTVRVTLPAKDSWPAVEEQLCPRCAHERGIRVKAPEGWDEAAILDGNPTFAKHLARILSRPVLPSLSHDADIHALGVTHVGGGFSASFISFYPSTNSEKQIEIHIPISELERKDIRSEIELIDYAKERILEAFRASGG